MGSSVGLAAEAAQSSSRPYAVLRQCPTATSACHHRASSQAVTAAARCHMPRRPTISRMTSCCSTMLSSISFSGPSSTCGGRGGGAKRRQCARVGGAEHAGCEVLTYKVRGTVPAAERDCWRAWRMAVGARPAALTPTHPPQHQKTARCSSLDSGRARTCTAWPVGEGTPVEPGRPPSARPTRLALLHNLRQDEGCADDSEGRQMWSGLDGTACGRRAGAQSRGTYSRIGMAGSAGAAPLAARGSLGHPRGLGSGRCSRRRRVVVLDVPEAALQGWSSKVLLLWGLRSQVLLCRCRLRSQAAASHWEEQATPSPARQLQ